MASYEATYTDAAAAADWRRAREIAYDWQRAAAAAHVGPQWERASAALWTAFLEELGTISPVARAELEIGLEVEGIFADVKETEWRA